MSEYQVYPNWKRAGHGPLRLGTVERNEETELGGIAGFVAAVTREAEGMARFYVFTLTPAAALFPGVPLWVGPYSAHSEEIIGLEER